jgi:hypothetical protein
LSFGLVVAVGHAGEFQPPTQEAVDTAIERGVEWLRGRQSRDGSWGPCVAGWVYDGSPTDDLTCYHIGPTAFAIYTLAKCGVPASEPEIRRGLRWLRKKARRAADSTGRDRDYDYTTYESAAVILMLTALHLPRADGGQPVFFQPSKSPSRPPAGLKFPRDDWKWMHERVEHLVGGRSGKDPCQVPDGGWGYWETNDEYQDVSATQFCLLALREAVRAGYPVSETAPETWRSATKALLGLQLENGAFPYRRGCPWSAGMTAAGVAGLLICKEQMMLAEQTVPTELVPAVKKGLAFLDGVFDVTRNRWDVKAPKNDWDDGYHYYHLYALERVGALSGRNEIGGKSWYWRGAAFLLREQEKSGRWEDDTSMAPEDVLGTSFALLFLKRATPPALTAAPDGR